MVDELTRRIKANFKLCPQDITSDIDKAAGIVTTSSPEAYKYYVEGSGTSQGRVPPGHQSMEKAVALTRSLPPPTWPGLVIWQSGLFC